VAGGPVRFDASATVVPAHEIPRYEWDFGDGYTGLGRTLQHRYRRGGEYRAVLSVWIAGSNLVARDSATVRIESALPARAFVAPKDLPIVLRSARPTLTIRLERIGEEYEIEDVALGGVGLWRESPDDGDSSAVFAAEKMIVADQDKNGEPELGIVFRTEDVGRLFSSIRGRRTIEAYVQGSLPSGAYVRAPVTLVVIGMPSKPVRVWPNPLNPTGVIAFEMPRAGHATLRLYDVHGRLVRTLWDRMTPAGEASVPFDGTDARGEVVATGVYFFRLEVPGHVHKGRVTVLK
jgi:hypothetical protein